MNIHRIKAMIYNRRNRENIYCREEYWNDKAKELHGNAVSMWPNNYLNEHYHNEVKTTLRTLLGNVLGKNIFDVGCGIGRLCRALADEGALVEGIDFSAASIAIAMQAEEHKNRINYRVQSVFELEDKNKYDIAITWGVLTIACRNGKELENALERIHAALLDGGSLLLLEAVHGGFLHRVLNMDINSFLKIMQKTGFCVLEVRDMHFWPSRLLLAYLPWPAWFTSVVYHVGQWIMKTIFANRAMGDYKAILAVARNNPPEKVI